MASVTIDIDLPPGVTLTGYQRHQDGHAFEVDWPWPERCRCDHCRRDEDARIEVKDSVQVVRDLDLWGQPTFWVYQPAFHRCSYCNHRQHLLPPFKRRDTSYTYRFEQHVLRLLIGSNEEEVARRLGISAQTVGLIVRNQLADAGAKQVDPGRVVTDVGIDELSLKKRPKLYVTILTDLTNPDRPQVLAVAQGRDEAAGRKCLEKLTEQQRFFWCRRTGPTWANRFTTPAGACCPMPRRWSTASTSPRSSTRRSTESGKKITRGYKAKLTKAQRKEFRSLMWEFRRAPQSLSEEEKAKLEGLFVKLPRLRTLYAIRVRFQEIFDTAPSRRSALRSLTELWLEMLDQFPEMEPFIRTFETWQEEILNYFEAGQTSGPVEGINNKARVIVKRAYGLKSADSLWTRLILDLNRARDVVTHTIGQIRDLVVGLRALFSPACT